MKDIMYNIGEKDFNGIGSFEFIPSCDKNYFQQLEIVDLFNTTFEDFKHYLCREYSHQKITVINLITSNSPNTKFVKSQYKEALKQLENEGRISCIPDKNNRKKGTLADTVQLLFP